MNRKQVFKSNFEVKKNQCSRGESMGKCQEKKWENSKNEAKMKKG